MLCAVHITACADTALLSAAIAVAAAMQTANEILSRGYSAVYYLNSTGQYELAASVLRKQKLKRKDSQKYTVDVALPRYACLYHRVLPMFWLYGCVLYATTDALADRLGYYCVLLTLQLHTQGKLVSGQQSLPV
jgi:hypothetical protein